MQRMREIRSRYGLDGVVQIHHIIPREHRSHPQLRWFGIDSCVNLMFLPSTSKLAIETRRKVHNGGHAQYNKYVLSRLNGPELMDPVDLAFELRHRLRQDDPLLPWK